MKTLKRKWTKQISWKVIYEDARQDAVLATVVVFGFFSRCVFALN